MSFLFGSSKTPDEGAIKAEEKKKIRGGATKGTILTGPLGLTDEPTTLRKTLLGQ
jgi:hypothetical protein